MSWDRALLLSFLLASYTSCLAGKSPGIRTTFTQACLDYGARVFSGMIQENVDNIRIPASSGDIASPIGTVQYYIKNMDLTNFDMGRTSLGVVPGVGARMSISVDTAGVKGDWGYAMKSKFLPVSDSGSFDVSVEAAYIDFAISITKHKTGRPSAAMATCDAGIGNMELTFHGGASWLYNMFSPVIVEKLKSQLGGMLCDAVNKSVDDRMDGGMADTPVIIPLGGDVFLDMTLVDDMVFGIGTFQTLVKGNAHWNGASRSPTAGPRDLPQTNYTGAPRMLYYDVTEYFFNSLGKAFFQSGVLSGRIRASDVPVESPIQLRSSDNVIKTVLPEIHDKYPNASLEVHLNASAPPKVSITEDGAVLSLAGRAVTYVSDREGKMIPLFGAQATMDVPVSFRISGINLVANISESLARVEIKPLKSKVGVIGPDVLKLLEQYLCRKVVIPWFNRYLEVGVPIKLNKVKYVNPDVYLHQNYLTVETDIFVITKNDEHVTSSGMRTGSSGHLTSTPSPATRLQTHHTPS